jgi:hypothetical protein
MEIQGFSHLGSSELGGRPDGLQVVGSGTRLFISHLFSGGFSEVDVSDPRRPRLLGFVPAPPGTWSLHLQVQDDLLLVSNGPDMWSMPIDFDPGRTRLATGPEFAAGLRMFDVSRPGKPVEVGFADTGGAGVHRAWYDGGPHALVSAVPPGFGESILLTIDVSDPSTAHETSRSWLPGLGEGESRDWPEDHHVSLHHATTQGDHAYGAWRDGGITVQPVGRDGVLGPAARLVWDGPDGRGCAAHSAVRLPGTSIVAVAEEGLESDGEPQAREVVLVDVQDPDAPRRVGALPRPVTEPVPGARFGPHNLYEYRPGAWLDGGTVFVAHQGAGLRVYDVPASGDSPEEVACFVPDPPMATLDPRPARALVPQTNDAFVTPEGIVAVVDANCGLHLLELSRR